MSKTLADGLVDLSRRYGDFHQNLTLEKIMDASVNHFCGADLRRDDECLEVGLEAIASSHRGALAAEATSQRGFNHADGTAQRMAIAELGAIDRVGDEVCDTSRDIMKDICDTDRHLTDVIGRHGLHNADVTRGEARHLDSEIGRTSDKTQDEVEKFGLRELDAIHGAEKYLYAGMSQNAKEMLLEFQRTKLEIKDGNKDLLLQACGNAKDAALAARDLMHQADKNTAAIQLEAFRHKEDLARQIAECCCEQKELVRQQASDTQQLIRELDKDRIKDERDKLREELIALRVRSTLPPPLVASVPL